MRNTDSSADPLPPSLLLLLSAAAGIMVANIYYNQPMLGLLARDFAVGGAEIGSVPVLTQVGYALGLLLLSPLGDIMERKRLILITASLLTIMLVVTALAPSLAVMFSGGAIGSALGARAWAGWGWAGVCALGLGLCVVAAAVEGAAIFCRRRT